MKTGNILSVIGQTPVVKINNIFSKEMDVWIKLEHLNPGEVLKIESPCPWSKMQREKDYWINRLQ